jgi:hypothetical protein
MAGTVEVEKVERERIKSRSGRSLMPLPPLGRFSSQDVAGFLSEHGFTADPAGLIPHYPCDSPTSAIR